MITAEVENSINNTVLCWLATVSAAGAPNVSPKEIFTKWDADHILIANIMSPNSTKNIQVNPHVCVSFVDVLVQKGFQLKGKAEVIKKNNEAFDELHQPLFDMAGTDYPIISIIKIKVTSVKPILAPRYVLFPSTTEKEQIESAKKIYGL